MISTSSSLADWQQLLLLSNQMLALAQTQQWEALIDGELCYIQEVNALSERDANAAESPYPSKVQDILRQLLDNEKEVKRLLLERMDELKVLIHQGNQQQSVNLTYGRLAGMLLPPHQHHRYRPGNQPRVIVIGYSAGKGFSVTAFSAWAHSGVSSFTRCRSIPAYAS